MRQRSLLILMTSVSLVATGACGSGVGPSATVRLELTDTLFTRADGLSASVPFTLANRSGRAVLVPRCGDALIPMVERWDGRAWATYAGGICITSVAMDPVTLAPGADRSGMVSIGEPARFRLVLTVVDPPRRVASRGFVVR